MALPIDYVNDFDAEVSETDSFAEGIYMDRFVQQLRLFPQEKIFLFTDKQKYDGGEQIKIRAYVNFGATYIPDNASRDVYVELINPEGSIVSRTKLREEKGSYQGHLLIPDNALARPEGIGETEDVYVDGFVFSHPVGEFTLRAYTPFMHSEGNTQRSLIHSFLLA